MKTKLSLFQYLNISLFFVFAAIIIQPLSAKNAYNLNGRIVYENNGKYFSMHDQDTVYIGTQFLTVVFDQSKELYGKDILINQYGLQYVGSSSGKYFVFRLPSSTKYEVIINAINNFSAVDYTILDLLGKGSSATSFPNDPTPPDGDNIQQTWWVGDPNSDDSGQYLNLLAAWGLTTANPALKSAVENVKVAVIDDGIDWTQTDFPVQNNLGMDFTTIPPSTNTQMTCLSYPQNAYGFTHGTAVASVIFSRANNNSGIFGVAGGWKQNGSFITDGATPIIEVCKRDYTNDQNVGGNSLALVALCLQHAVDKGANVINISLNWVNATQVEMQPVIDKINEILYPPYPNKNNTTIIVSAGNYSVGSQPQNVKFPGTIESVISVGGALADHKRKEVNGSSIFTGGSCWGAGLDFVTSFLAPTNNGYCNTSANQLQVLPGTSYSAAMLSGVVALMYAVNPCLSHQEVFEILKASCYKNPYYTFTYGWNAEVGYGFPNAYKAVLLAMGEDSYTLTTNETWTGTRIFRGDVIIPVGKKLILDGATVKFSSNAGITLQGSGSLLEIRNQSKLTNVCNNMWKGISMVLSPNSPPNPFANQDIYINNSTIEYAINALNVPYGVKVIAKNNTRFTNNTLSAFFNAAYYKNLSWFENCTFENTEEHLDQNNAQYMVKMLQNSGASFYGCNFVNNTLASIVKKYGIYAYSSKFTVTGSCSNPSISPCPEGSIVYSTFSKLNYGIYSFGGGDGFKVERTNFINNNCGIYASNNPNVKIWKNNFQIPSSQDPDPRGAYFNNCTGYSIEGNDFTIFPGSTSYIDEVGLYIRNSGTAQNYVYHNTFSKLDRGAVADEKNRSSNGNTGLCFKCNDFSETNIDIDVQHDDGAVIDNYYGIAKYQGAPTTVNPDTLSAANTFSKTAVVYSIRNRNQPFSYYYHGNNNTGYKINPTPIEPITSVTKILNSNTSYNRNTICKPWLNTGGTIGQQLASKSIAQSNAEATSLQLQNLVDGGSTANLTFDILGSTPPEAMVLRDQLIDESPYLSDTVLKTAIGQENVLPNALLRDILVENPQVAKSDEIMSMLDERFEPMPDYMKTEIDAGKEIIGGREQLETLHAVWQQNEGFLFNSIVSKYIEDTLNPNAIADLKTFLHNDNTAQAGFALADINIQQNDYQAAGQAINTMQANLDLDAAQNQQATDYLSIIGILQNLVSGSIQPYALDSLHAIPLFALYQNGNNSANALARDMLIASGLLDYEEPVNTGETVKSVRVKTINTDKKSINEILRLFPNPAGTFTIVEYELPSTNNSILSFTNSGGIVVKQLKLIRVKDQIVIDIQDLLPGYYTVSLMNNSKSIASKNISIVR